MPITRTPIIDDDGTGTTGTVLDNAWKQELYDQIDGPLGTGDTKDASQDASIAANAAALAALGKWADVPFSAANFSGTSPLVWTVGAAAIVRNRYMVIGKTLFWGFYISWFSGSNVLSGSPAASLNITLPGGFSVNAGQAAAMNYTAIGGTINPGIQVTATGSGIVIARNDGANFAAGQIPGFITTVILEIA